jgi:hypothetical protein
VTVAATVHAEAGATERRAPAADPERTSGGGTGPAAEEAEGEAPPPGGAGAASVEEEAAGGGGAQKVNVGIRGAADDICLTSQSAQPFQSPDAGGGDATDSSDEDTAPLSQRITPRGGTCVPSTTNTDTARSIRAVRRLQKANLLPPPPAAAAAAVDDDNGDDDDADEDDDDDDADDDDDDDDDDR